MKLSTYLKQLDKLIIKDDRQKKWFERLSQQIKASSELRQKLSFKEEGNLMWLFINRIRTEEIKAWYSSPEEESLFQGTSISSITIPAEFSTPLDIKDISFLESVIAEQYILLHNKYKDIVRDTIIDNVDNWLNEGLFYGVTIASKVISQAFNLTAFDKEVVFKVDRHLVDPHEIFSYPQDIREKYFQQIVNRIHCFDGMKMRQEEIESSLILGDISKPHLEKYRSKILLAPIKCNEIASLMAKNIKTLVKNKSRGKINPHSLSVTIYDTDTPYTYHRLIGCEGISSPVLPGLSVLGTSGSIDAFRWLYSYRVSLVTQKIQKGSLYGEVYKKHVPFVFFGVLVPRDAEILLDLNRLDLLRYRGNLSPQIEYGYLIHDLYDFYYDQEKKDLEKELDCRLKY